MQEKKEVLISLDLFKKIESKLLENNEKKDVNEYIENLLRKMIDIDDIKVTENKEEKEIIERLKKLGYL